jgi:hypothetical protein
MFATRKIQDCGYSVKQKTLPVLLLSSSALWALKLGLRGGLPSVIAAAALQTATARSCHHKSEVQGMLPYTKRSCCCLTPYAQQRCFGVGVLWPILDPRARTLPRAASHPCPSPQSPAQHGPGSFARLNRNGLN